VKKKGEGSGRGAYWGGTHMGQNRREGILPTTLIELGEVQGLGGSCFKGRKKRKEEKDPLTQGGFKTRKARLRENRGTT